MCLLYRNLAAPGFHLVAAHGWYSYWADASLQMPHIWFTHKCNQRKEISVLAARTLITRFSAVNEEQPGRIVGMEMRRWGLERAAVGEHEQQELVWMLTGVISSSSTRCCQITRPRTQSRRYTFSFILKQKNRGNIYENNKRWEMSKA